MKSGKDDLKWYVISMYKENIRRKVLEHYQQWSPGDRDNKFFFLGITLIFFFETASCYVLPGWFWTCYPPVLPYVLGLQECATIPGCFFILKYLIMSMNYFNDKKGKVKQYDMKQRGKHQATNIIILADVNGYKDSSNLIIFKAKKRNGYRLSMNFM